MAEEKVDVALLNNANEYVEVYKLSQALQMIMAEPARYGATGPDLKVEKFIEIIMNNYNNKALHLHSVYRSKPSEETLRKALAAARNLTLKKPGKSMEAVKEISDHPEILTNSYTTFKQDQDERLDSSVENVADLKAELKEQKKANAKQKRKLGWGIFGKIATAVVGAAVGASYLTSVFTLAGGFVGMASISTMPFMLLGAAGGALLYWAGKKALGTIWKALSESNDAARQVLKGDENVKGSNKALKKAKQLEKQNVKALNRMRANMNACAPENAEAYADFEKFVNNTLVKPEKNDSIKIENAVREEASKEETKDAIFIKVKDKKDKDKKDKDGPEADVDENSNSASGTGERQKGSVVLETDGQGERTSTDEDKDKNGRTAVIEPLTIPPVYTDVFEAQKNVDMDKKAELENNLVDIIYKDLGLTHPNVRLQEAHDMVRRDVDAYNQGKDDKNRKKVEFLVDPKSRVPMSNLVNNPVLTEQEIAQKRAIESAARNVVSMFDKERAPYAEEVKDAIKGCSAELMGKELDVDAVFGSYKRAIEKIRTNDLRWKTVFSNQDSLKDQLTKVIGEQAENADEIYSELLKGAAIACVQGENKNAILDSKQIESVKQIIDYYSYTNETDEAPELPMGVSPISVQTAMSGVIKRQQEAVAARERAQQEMKEYMSVKFDGNKRSVDGMIIAAIDEIAKDDNGKKLLIDSGASKDSLNKTERDIKSNGSDDVFKSKNEDLVKKLNEYFTGKTRDMLGTKPEMLIYDNSFNGHDLSELEQQIMATAKKQVDREIEQREAEEERRRQEKEDKRTAKANAKAERKAEEARKAKELEDARLEEKRVRAETEAAHKKILEEDINAINELLEKHEDSRAKRIKAAKSKLNDGRGLSEETNRIYNEHRQAIVDENKKKDPHGRAKISDANIIVDALKRTRSSLSEMTQEDQSKVRNITKADIERENDRNFLKELLDMITGKNKKTQDAKDNAAEMERE